MFVLPVLWRARCQGHAPGLHPAAVAAHVGAEVGAKETAGPAPEAGEPLARQGAACGGADSDSGACLSVQRVTLASAAAVGPVSADARSSLLIVTGVWCWLHMVPRPLKISHTIL